MARKQGYSRNSVDVLVSQNQRNNHHSSLLSSRANSRPNNLHYNPPSSRLSSRHSNQLSNRVNSQLGCSAVWSMRPQIGPEWSRSVSPTVCIESLDPTRAPRAPTHPLKHSGTDRTRPDHQNKKSWDVSRFEGKSDTKSGTELLKIYLLKYFRWWWWAVSGPKYVSVGYSLTLEKHSEQLENRVEQFPEIPRW